MPTFEASIEIDAPSEAIFDLTHDYDRRLEWDPLLREARLLDGARRADVGVKSLCVGRGGFVGVGVETVYVSFERPTVAAVTMTSGPWFFERFAASIRHVALPGGATRVTYRGNVTTQPRWLRRVLDPIVLRRFGRETEQRLAALKRACECAQG
ncbi:MAG: SRPBCC family protein [Planctomycetota bacterium]